MTKTDWAAIDAEFSAWTEAIAAGDVSALRSIAEAKQEAAQQGAYHKWTAAAYRWTSAADAATAAGDYRHGIHWHQRAAWCWQKANYYAATAFGACDARRMAEKSEQAARALDDAAREQVQA